MSTSPVLQPFEQLQESVSNEAFNPKAIKEYVQAAGNAISGLVRKTLEWDTNRPVVLKTPAIDRAFKKTTYMDMANVTLQVPVGFGSTHTLRAYAERLETIHLPLLTTGMYEVLSAVQGRVGRYLSHPEELDERALASDARRVEKRLTEWLTAAHDTMKTDSVYFVTQSHNNTVPFQSAFHRLSDYPTTTKILNTVNDVRWKKHKPATIQKEVKDLSAVSNALFREIEKRPDGASQSTLQHLSTILTVAGSMVEYYSAMTAQVIDFTEAMVINERKILRML